MAILVLELWVALALACFAPSQDGSNPCSSTALKTTHGAGQCTDTSIERPSRDQPGYKLVAQPEGVGTSVRTGSESPSRDQPGHPVVTQPEDLGPSGETGSERTFRAQPGYPVVAEPPGDALSLYGGFEPAFEGQPSTVLVADLDGDGQAEEVSVFMQVDGRLGFFTVQGSDRLTVSSIYPLWAVYLGELDDVPGAEIVLGIWSSDIRHDEPGPHRSVWVLRWSPDGLNEVWRGSALSRPLLDIRVADLDADGQAELVALERTGDACFVVAYRWNGFGFVGLARNRISCTGLSFCAGAVDSSDSACLESNAGRSMLELGQGLLRLGE